MFSPDDEDALVAFTNDAGACSSASTGGRVALGPVGGRRANEIGWIDGVALGWGCGRPVSWSTGNGGTGPSGGGGGGGGGGVQR